ncbi:hypothetical protein IWQ47_000690 [Aquimarina sp. EL_43]|uniref:M57 family metalloprotease n=1 Tax=unclassified Aquimarina TaxID=2627091 RepID=UPI0018CB09E4|nr:MULTISPECIES: M57 family metalloprotease [unclassified Aquimarina]MBG6128620.1 hypothetical protein [Aquimarina sp. EL_35]MBG6149683.1 hypothetical protein [Aquimarina sp. EL_32]MBG6167632.1 hypothetical protein [Aquimarina sp. EL_43]
MKTKPNFRFIRNTFLSVFMITALISCQKEELSNETSQEIPTSQLSKEVKEKLFSLGVNANYAEEYTSTDANGLSREGWLIGDIFISKKDLFEMPSLDVNPENGQKLFRTTNLVTSNRTYRIDISGLPQAYKDGVVIAIQRYNALGLNIKFTVGVPNPHIVVRLTNRNIAQFPRNGNPGRTIELQRGLDQDLIAAVMMHEMGHAIGLRHSDYRTRRSCVRFGSPITDEGPDTVGAIHIPGTDNTGDNNQSIMVACGYETGQALFSNFSGQDRTALRYLY